MSYTYPLDNDYFGIVTAYSMFRGKGGIEEKLHRFLSDAGYTCDTMGGSPKDDNYVIVKGISNGIWFFTYHFTILLMFAVYPFLIVLTILLPAILYKQTAKISIVERLRQN